MSRRSEILQRTNSVSFIEDFSYAATVLTLEGTKYASKKVASGIGQIANFGAGIKQKLTGSVL